MGSNEIAHTFTRRSRLKPGIFDHQSKKILARQSATRTRAPLLNSLSSLQNRAATPSVWIASLGLIRSHYRARNVCKPHLLTKWPRTAEPKTDTRRSPL